MSCTQFIRYALMAAMTVAMLPPRLAAAAPAQGIDDEILKAVAEETRINFLANQVSDLDIHLPLDQQAGFFNKRPVADEAGRVARGQMKRDAFLAHAPKLLKARREEVDKVLGDKAAAAKELVSQPRRQAELRLELLSDAVTALHLAADNDKPRVLLAKRLQALFDEDAKDRLAKQRGKPQTQRDAEWLEKTTTDIEAALFKLLKPEEKKEILRVWDKLFPDGDPPVPKAEAAGA